MKKSNLKDDVEILEEMITSLVELLEDKGLIKEGDWDKRLREKIKKKKRLTRFEEL